jgi:hypothetical protein
MVATDSIKKFVLLALLFGGCYKNHLYVQQEWVTPRFLASSHVKAPDPRQEDFIPGQRLLVGWDFPKSLFCQDLLLIVTIRLWDQTERVFTHPILYRRDAVAFSLPGPEKEKRILTYRAEVINRDDELVDVWEHQFWVEQIEI